MLRRERDLLGIGEPKYNSVTAISTQTYWETRIFFALDDDDANIL